MSTPEDSTITRPPFAAMDGVAEAAVPFLLLVYSEGPDASIGGLTPLRGGSPVVIGRRPAASGGERGLNIASDGSASRRHARLTCGASGVRVEDLGSRNGTWVDGTRLQSTRELPPGRVLRVGGTLWVVAEAPLVRRERMLREHPPPEWMCVRGQRMLHVWDSLRRLAGGELPVLLTGEMGTGKTRLAAEVHRLAGRGGPFVAFNCSAIPHHLEEATLFGVAPGFIPNVKQRDGLLSRARGGTLFLDEVADMPALAQAKLLDAFDSHDPGFVPVGGTRRVPTECRLVSATNRDVYAMGRTGELRPDLVSRLVVGQVAVPPLRERREELLAVFAALLETRGLTLREVVPRVELAEALLLGGWWENVRGLEGLAARVSLGEALTLSGIAEQAGRGGPGGGAEPAAGAGPPAPQKTIWPPPRRELLEMLAAHDWKVADLARKLGLRRETVSRRVSGQLGGRTTAQQIWRVWKASGRLPETEEVGALFDAYVEAPQSAGAADVRARWEAGP